MKCHETRKLFPLYHDSEGDAEVQLQIGDHLAMCPDCKAWFQRQGRCEDAVADLINGGRAGHGHIDTVMWERIEQTVLPQPTGIRRRPRVLVFATVAVALLAGVGLVFVALNQGGFAPAAHLSRLAAIEHDRYVQGTWQAPLVSDSVEDVERWLQAGAGFAVRCPPKGRQGFRLEGGGVCRFGTERSAHIVGSVDGRHVSIFVLDGGSLPLFPDMALHVSLPGQIHQCHEDPYDMVASQLHGHVVIVMGEGDVSVLRDILRGYGDHHSEDEAAEDTEQEPPARRQLSRQTHTIFIHPTQRHST